MAKKFAIGLVYLLDANWIGGTYYVENIVHSLRRLPLEDQPFLKIYCYSKGEFNSLKSKTSYELMIPVYLIYTHFVFKAINRLSILFFKNYLFVPPVDADVDVLYLSNDLRFFRHFKKKVFWIPDFQEYHFPNFFKAEERLFRKHVHEKIIKEKYPIILSSKSAYDDFRLNYPTAINTVYIIPFAVTIPNLTGIKPNTVKEKFKIEGEYFISSNQFWAHKNHIAVIKAIQELLKKDLKVTLLFTGKPFDSRNPGYFEELVSYVKSHNLDGQIKFLGFIDRVEQLVLMKNSLAIIQPSWFEGWSTVVEDAKALGHTVFVSDIPVHREQLGNNHRFFFEPNDYVSLARFMEEANEKEIDLEIDYDANIRAFSNNFLNALKEISTT